MVIYYIEQEHVYLRPYVYSESTKQYFLVLSGLFFLPNFPGPTFIPCPTSIPEARVMVSQKFRFYLFFNYNMLMPKFKDFFDHKMKSR